MTDGTATEKKAHSEKVKKIVDELGKMTILELVELNEAIETTFGVKAAAPMMAMAAAPAAGAAAAPEVKTSFDVVLTDGGANKINVIKEVRAITNLGLKEAKALVESAPKPVKEGVPKEEADKLKAQIESAGGKVEIK